MQMFVLCQDPKFSFSSGENAGWPQHSICCPSVFAPFENLHCFRNQSKTARGILTKPEPTCHRVSWLPLGGATSLLSHAQAHEQGFKSLTPHLTLLLMAWQPLPVLHGGRQVSMILRMSPYICDICEILLLTVESQVLKNLFIKMLVWIWPLCWITLSSSHSLGILLIPATALLLDVKRYSLQVKEAGSAP